MTAGVIFVVFWALWRSVGVFEEILLTSPWAATSPSARNLLQIGSNIFKGVHRRRRGAGRSLGLRLPGVDAPRRSRDRRSGLRLRRPEDGGEPLRLRSSLAIDQPFRVGDFVKVEDFVGTVEEIGIRSTRFRTLDRTVISHPQRQPVGPAPRDLRRPGPDAPGHDHRRGVQHHPRADAARCIEGCERVLREHPKIWPDAMVVKFKEFGASSLDIEIMAWFQVPTWGDFQHCRQEVLLGFMKVVEDAGTGFAFPTRTLHVFNENASEPTKAPPRPEVEHEPIPSATARAGDLPVADNGDEGSGLPGDDNGPPAPDQERYPESYLRPSP